MKGLLIMKDTLCEIVLRTIRGLMLIMFGVLAVIIAFISSLVFAYIVFKYSIALVILAILAVAYIIGKGA